MTAAFLERDSFNRPDYVVLRIDVEGAEYIADIMLEEYLHRDDKGAREISDELYRATSQWHEKYDE